jgi:hypothetical protein
MAITIGPFEAELWVWQGPASWVFLSLPHAFADPVKRAAFLASTGPKRGWKLVPVQVEVGEVRWETSLFPDRETGSYILPVKAAMRRKLGVTAGDRISLRLHLKQQL